MKYLILVIIWLFIISITTGFTPLKNPLSTDDNATLEQLYNRAWRCNTPSPFALNNGPCFMLDQLNSTNGTLLGGSGYISSTAGDIVGAIRMEKEINYTAASPAFNLFYDFGKYFTLSSSGGAVFRSFYANPKIYSNRSALPGAVLFHASGEFGSVNNGTNATSYFGFLDSRNLVALRSSNAQVILNDYDSFRRAIRLQSGLSGSLAQAISSAGYHCLDPLVSGQGTTSILNNSCIWLEDQTTGSSNVGIFSQLNNDQNDSFIVHIGNASSFFNNSDIYADTLFSQGFLYFNNTRPEYTDTVDDNITALTTFNSTRTLNCGIGDSSTLRLVCDGQFVE